MHAKIFLALVLSLAGGNLFAQNLLVVTPKSTLTFNLIELKTKLKTHLIKIDDPVYKKKKEYDAFALQDILELAGAAPTEKVDELVFASVDGYSPNMAFSQLKKHKGYVAYQEHSTPGRFALLTVGKAKVSPWPFYLIWEEGGKLADDVPWPYQLVKIEMVEWKKKYPHVVPKNAADGSPEMKGFALFKAECIRCHSINLEGGDLGPELNDPKSVTEYWKPDVLRAYIKNNAEFRLKSKMPQFTKLSSEQLDDLIAYLKAMKP